MPWSCPSMCSQAGALAASLAARSRSVNGWPRSAARHDQRLRTSHVRPAPASRRTSSRSRPTRLRSGRASPAPAVAASAASGPRPRRETRKSEHDDATGPMTSMVVRVPVFHVSRHLQIGNAKPSLRLNRRGAESGLNSVRRAQNRPPWPRRAGAVKTSRSPTRARADV